MVSSVQTQIRLDLHLTRHGGVRWLRGDAAHVAGCADLQVASVTPAGAPAVLHQVIAVGGVQACCQHTMVEAGAAAGAQHTAGVALEGALVGLDGNGDRASLQGGLERRCAGAIGVAGDTTGRNGGGVAALAGAVTGSVWVRALAGNGGALVEGEGVVHETTVAARVLLGAVDQLLLRQGLQGASGNLPAALDTTGGRERPARAAVRLISYTAGDGSALRPGSADIEGVRDDIYRHAEKSFLHGRLVVALLTRHNGSQQSLHVGTGGVGKAGGNTGSPCGLEGIYFLDDGLVTRLHLVVLLQNTCTRGSLQKSRSDQKRFEHF